MNGYFKKRIVFGICTLFICMSFLGTGILTVVSQSQDKSESYENELQPSIFYGKVHNISIYIKKIWVFDCGDPWNKEPGEFRFFVFLFPAFQHSFSKIYEVKDDHPESSDDLGLISRLETRFTPQRILIVATELDTKDDLNFNELMDWKWIRFKPPRGDYDERNPYSHPKITWEVPQYFRAEISISFYYS